MTNHFIPNNRVMGDYAKYYVERGLSVLPLWAKGKTPLIRDGLTGASNQWEVAKKWWAEWPDANVGIRTGAISGIVVLDVDPAHDGEESLHEVHRRFGPLPPTPSVITGRGGSHYYFRHPGREVRNGAGIYGLSGLDIRGDGGYVVAPPSVTEGKYEWDKGSPRAFADLPDYLIVRRGETKTVSEGETFPEGQRNHSLLRLAGGMRRYGAGRDAILNCLLDTNLVRCSPPLRELEVEAIVNSVMRYTPDEVNFQSANGTRRGTGGDSGDSGDQRERPDGRRISESRLFRRTH